MRGRVCLVGEFGWVGEFALCGLAEVFAAVDADIAPAAGGAALAQGAGLAVGQSKTRGAGAVGAWPAGSGRGDAGGLALWAGDLPVGEIDGELVLVDRVGVGGPREVQRGEHL